MQDLVILRLRVVLPRMKNDIVDVFEACIDGTLDKVDFSLKITHVYV